jgi:glucose/arabinose dehydrogenase
MSSIWRQDFMAKLRDTFLAVLLVSLLGSSELSAASVQGIPPIPREGTPAVVEEPLSAATPIAPIPEAVAQPGGDLPGDPAVQLVKVVDGLADPVNVAIPPDGTNRVFVVERPGRIRIVEEGKLLEEPFLDITDQVLSAFLEQGLYSLAFHPDYANNGRFYVHFAELLRNGDSMIVEYQVSADDPNTADPESAKALLQIDQPFANHNGGEIAFGPDGYLYIGIGDGGWEGDPLEAGQNLGTLLGKLLRIDVNVGDDAAYRIPEGNPFAEDVQLVKLFGISEVTFASIHTEAQAAIWDYGLRNPYEFSFDPATGDLYIGDVGQNHWEEINFAPAGYGGGVNWGWDFLMGAHCFPIEAESCALVGTLPAAEYPHELGCAVIEFSVYRGGEESLQGINFAGDYCTGRVWGLARDEAGAWQFEELLHTTLRFTGAGQDPNGELYMTSCECHYGGREDPLTNPAGALWQLVPVGQVPQGAEAAPTPAPGTTPTSHEHQHGAGTPEPQQQEHEHGGEGTPEDDS